MSDSDYRWEPVDPLGAVLHGLRMTGTLYCQSELSAPWGFALPALPGCLMLHAVTCGRARLSVLGKEAVELGPGELALVPHGTGHTLSDSPGAPTPSFFDLDRHEFSARYETLRHGGGGARTALVCAVVRCDHPASGFLIQSLPQIIHVSGWGTRGVSEAAGAAEWIHSTLRLMDAEARALQPGGETLLTRLADALLVQAVRVWLASASESQVGWLSALRDPRVGPALAAVHRNPGRRWTVEALAEVAALSRSAFSERFTALVGEPPIRYLTRWRMAVAQSLLVEDGLTVGEVASRLGYESETAFSRAFKRIHGIPPGSASP